MTEGADPVIFETGLGLRDTHDGYPVCFSWNLGALPPYWRDASNKCLDIGATQVLVGERIPHVSVLQTAAASGELLMLLRTDPPDASIPSRRHFVHVTSLVEEVDDEGIGCGMFVALFPSMRTLSTIYAGPRPVLLASLMAAALFTCLAGSAEADENRAEEKSDDKSKTVLAFDSGLCSSPTRARGRYRRQDVDVVRSHAQGRHFSAKRGAGLAGGLNWIARNSSRCC